MRLRSLLFIPGDRPERMEKALYLGADALILDLEDSVSASAKEEARANVAAFLAKPRNHGIHILVRVNAIDGGLIDGDLDAIARSWPDAIMLPKAEGQPSIEALAVRLLGRGGSGIPILPIATETPAAIFELGSYRHVSERLWGITWGAEDLPAMIGATTSRATDGLFTPPYELARSLTLFAAHAAGVAAIETVFPDFRDTDGLTAYAARAARDGFSGMMAIHPGQIAAINAAFSPSEADLLHARAVIAMFEAHPGAGALQLDGRMIDAPHLKQAKALLARSDA